MAAETVPYVMLNDNTKIPQLGLGVWRASDREAEDAVREAFRVGYRLVDTAASYGNERGVGRAIRGSSIPREQIYVTTKLWTSDQGYASTFAAFEESLEKLGLDYIDLYLIHWPMPRLDKYIDTWRAFEELQKTGKIKSIGVSNFTQEHLERLMSETSVKPVLNQIEVHPDFQQTELRQYCHEHDIAVESWSPLGQGGDLLRKTTITQLAEQHERTPAQIVLRWHIQSGLIVIPKSVHAERIAENFDIFDFELSESDMNALFALDSGNRLGDDPAR